jgi:hyperosmotically inducible periplasmic protein
MRNAVLLFSISLLVLGGYAGTASPAERSLSPPTNMVPDNTDVNIHGRRGETPTTSDDQAERAVDRTLIQRIRQAIVADESLATTAKNVKVMMINGVVTLRGPVHSLQEKGSIAATAQHIAGTNKVDNQIEIKGY